jgi:hypothetical protein
MSHVDPNMSSGSSPGATLAIAPQLKRVRASNSRRAAFQPPHWTGEKRPCGARRVRAQTKFPSIAFLTYLVKDLGYDGHAAFAAMTQAHQPWLHTVDRRRGTAPHHYSPIVCPMRPYIPAAPSRRTRTGGGLTKQQVQEALAKKGWDQSMKGAMLEIVYRRRSNLEVSDESGIPVEVLYVYASRLRRQLRTAGLRAPKKAA